MQRSKPQQSTNYLAIKHVYANDGVAVLTMPLTQSRTIVINYYRNIVFVF